MMENSWPQDRFLAQSAKNIVEAIALSPYDSYYNASIFEISFLAISKEERRKGVGNLLLNSALKFISGKLKQKGIKLAMLFVQADGENKATTKFYGSIFKSIGK